MRGCKLLAFSALAVIAATTHSVAEGRDNPFKRPPTEAERQAARDARTREIVTDMIPAIERVVMRQVERKVSESEVRNKRRTDEINATLRSIQSSIDEIKENGVAVASTPGTGGTEQTETSESPKSKIPEGATFISCVNGKALYRASDTLITIDASEAPASSGCAG